MNPQNRPSNQESLQNRSIIRPIADYPELKFPDLPLHMLSHLEVPPEISSKINFLMRHGNGLPLAEVRELVAALQPACKNHRGAAHSFKEVWSTPLEHTNIELLTELTICRSYYDRDILLSASLEPIGVSCSGQKLLKATELEKAHELCSKPYARGLLACLEPESSMRLSSSVFSRFSCDLSYSYHGNDVYERSFCECAAIDTNGEDIVLVRERTFPDRIFAGMSTTSVTRQPYTIEYQPVPLPGIPVHQDGWKCSVSCLPDSDALIENTGEHPVFFRFVPKEP